LGGNRKGTARMYCNLMLVFLLSGLWHGAGWNYILWGAMHGILYVLTRLIQRRKSCNQRFNILHKHQKIVTVVSQIALFIYVSVAWVYFRADSIRQANEMLLAAVRGPIQKISMELAECYELDEFWYVIKVLHLDNMAYSRYILMTVMLAAGIYFAMIGRNAAQRMERMKYNAGTAAVFAVLAVWCVLTFSKVSTFLYFNF
jgi:hypothetical protein